MRPHSVVSFALGISLCVLGVITMVRGGGLWGMIPFLVGAALGYLGWRGDRTALVLFGHVCVVLGCFLITWGVYLLPYSEPTLPHIFGRPLFWGLFSLMGGICAIYHGFCQCIRIQK